MCASLASRSSGRFRLSLTTLDFQVGPDMSLMSVESLGVLGTDLYGLAHRIIHCVHTHILQGFLVQLLVASCSQHELFFFLYSRE